MNRTIASIAASIAAACVGASPPGVLAQEAMYTAAATMPSPHTLILRQQFHYFRYGEHPIAGTSRTEKYESMTTVAYGLDRGLALSFDVPAVVKREKDAATGESDWDRGVEDLQLTLKWRFYQSDTGGINTVRAALLVGAGFASGDDRDFSSQSVNPRIGGVVTVVRGRHGFNQDLIYRFNTGGDPESNDGGDGPDDALSFNTAYLYRVFPARYTPESTGAWYITAEVNGLYETNGDVELRWAPGLMFEGRRLGLEVMAQFPLYHDLDERGELDLALGVGLRLLF